jgi:glyoxylase-like metal-dependent hydrolase (beta-lactamase superfamily II)
MFRKFMIAGGLALILTVFVSMAAAQDARTVINNASKAMGADNLKTLQFTATGSEYAFGQAMNSKSPWPGFEDKNYTRTINFETPAWRVERVLAPIAPSRKGGGLPPAANQTFVINANTIWAQQLDHWMTPQGFLRAATTNNATAQSQKVGGKTYSVVTFMGQNKAKVNGYINDQNMVEKVETWIDNPVTGDTLLESVYTGYRDFGGVKFPTRIVRRQGDYPVLDLTVTDVKPNAPANIQAPAAGGGGQAPQTTSRQLGDGVFLILGGYASIAVDFKDYIVVVEGGNSEANATAIINEAKRVIPNKPIRYLVNTHSHFDHSSGLRRFMAEGATIITHETNKQYFAKLATLPHTLNPDTLAKNQKKASVEGMKDKRVLTDGNHVIELYRLVNSTHNDGLIVAYFPKEKVLLEADGWNPPAEADAAPSPINNAIYNKNLMDNVQRLKLNVETMVPVHYPGTRAVTFAEFTRAVSRASSTN